MGVVVSHKGENVTIGITDKDLRIVPEFTQTTFKDVFGVLHTVYSHKDGPFKTAEEVVAAFEKDILHTFESHEQAQAFFKEHGDTDQANRLQAHIDAHATTRDTERGDDF